MQVMKRWLAIRTEIRVALLYALFGSLWILFSDRLLAAFTTDIATLNRLQTYKGWAFVAASALLIFSLLGRELQLRRNAEGEYHESEERYRLLVENDQDAILLCTPEGQILSANPSACRMFGRSEADLLRLGLNGLSEVTVPHLKATWQQRLRLGTRNEELLLSRRGSPFPAEVTTSSFTSKDGQLCCSLIIRDITYRRQAEQALRESEKRYRLISENSADVIWTLDLATSYFTYVSPSVYNLRGFTPEEVLAQPMQAALTPASYQFISENLPARLKAFAEGAALARTAVSEVDQVRKDGSIVPTEVVTTLLTDASGQVVEILGVSRNISERRESEAQIQRQLRHLRGLHEVDLAISSSFDLNVIFNVVLVQLTEQLHVDAAVILLLNPELHVIEYAASRGLSPETVEQLQNRPASARAHRLISSRKLIHSHGLGFTAEEPGPPALHGDGLAGYAEYVGVPLIAKGEVQGVLELYHHTALPAGHDWLQFLETLARQAAIAIDNAHLFHSLQRANARLEARVAERTAELRHANFELEHANRAKDEFLATMSHELRTPLNSILGLSESLLEGTRGPLSEAQEKYVHTIQASARHLFDLISDILDLSKIEAGKFDYHPQVVQVDELCRSSLAFVHEQAVRKAMELTYHNDSPIPRISADPRRLKQVLINLLVNAVKFTPPGGQVTLQVCADLPADRISFTVADTGIGIAAHDIPKLFQPFVQVDGSLNREYEGTGLGLALVQKLVDLHGGSVAVESEGIPGQGSRFTVCLPLGLERLDGPLPGDAASRVSHSRPLVEIEAAQGLKAPPAGQGYPSRPPTPRGCKVLLAEDQSATVLMLTDFLDQQGYEIVVAHDGEEAVEKAQRYRPDLILMDIQMPVMDGLAATARLRRDLHFARTPIIALTALAMPGDRERCLQAGVNEYLSKPVSLRTLAETIEKLLKKA